MKIIKNRIINPEEIDVKGMVYDILDFKKEVHDSIQKGDLSFLPLGSAKEKEAYKDPGSEQSYRGVLAWNLIYPDNQIDVPAKVSLLKMNIFTEEDMKDMEQTYPDIYEAIMKYIFHDMSGVFVTKKLDPGIDYIKGRVGKDWHLKLPEKYRSKYKKLGPKAWNEFVDSVMDDPTVDKKGKWNYKKRGLQVLAIPSNAEIPDWAKPYIDYATMVNNIVAPFKPVLEIFGPQFTEEGRTRNTVNRKSDTVTNIVKF